MARISAEDPARAERLFAERVTLRQWLAGGVTALGVVLAAFG